MLNFKSKMLSLNENVMYLGEKRVEINKLTPKRWRQLFDTIDTLPGLIVQVLNAPKEDFYAYVVSACDVALEEVVRVVAVLTDLDAEYIDENVGVDELILYLSRTAKRNNLSDVIKNVGSLLTKA